MDVRSFWLHSSPFHRFQPYYYAVLKLISTKQFLMIWSVTVAVTLVGSFIIGIVLFWYSKFIKFCTFLQLSWSNTLSLKSPAIWNFLFDFFVLWKMQFRNFSKGSDNPFGGLYKTLINVFRFFLHKSSIEIDSTSVLLVLRSGQGLKFLESFMQIETPPPFP